MRSRHACCPLSSQHPAVLLRTVDLAELEPGLSTSDNRDIPLPGHLQRRSYGSTPGCGPGDSGPTGRLGGLKTSRGAGAHPGCRLTLAGENRPARALGADCELFLLCGRALALAERNTGTHCLLLYGGGGAAQGLCRLRCRSAARELLQCLEFARAPRSPITRRTFCHHHLQTNIDNPRIIHVGAE